MYVAKRSDHNPILSPDSAHYWEGFATFNMSVVKKGRTTYGFYRAMSLPDSMREPHQMSSIGIGKSSDGLHFKERRQFIAPKEEWEKYGCEDPRVTYFEGKYYIFYTALSTYPFGPDGIKVAVAISKDLKKVDERHLVTPFNAKAMTLFPERVNGKIVVMFSAFTDVNPAKMVFAYLDRIEDLWNKNFWDEWSHHVDDFTINLKRFESDNVEVGAPPIKTKHGWLLLYSHIQNYYRHDGDLPTIFGIEAILLDLKDPMKIIGRTRGPILVPEEHYEVTGYVSNIVFPSGAVLDRKILTVYYGASDTGVCAFKVNIEDLIGTMHPKLSGDYMFKRWDKNPIITPIEANLWEAQSTYNPGAIELGGKVHLLYRALSKDNTSSIGYAMSVNGFDIVERLMEPVYTPKEDFENKKIPNANSGCEDPRLTKIGKNIYMCYVAYDSVNAPHVAITSISEKNFLAKNWLWEKPFLVTPRDVDDKDTALFGEKFKDGYFIVHRVSNEICGDYLSSLDSDHAMVKKCIRIMGPRRNTWDSAKVGIACPPIKTTKGWLLLYHGVSKSHSTYRVGVALLDLKDPAIVLARSSDPLFEPVMEYEKSGLVNGVVFPCGAVVRKGVIYIYYGGGDRVIGVATMKLKVILDALVNGMKL